MLLHARKSCTFPVMHTGQTMAGTRFNSIVIGYETIQKHQFNIRNSVRTHGAYANTVEKADVQRAMHPAA